MHTHAHRLFIVDQVQLCANLLVCLETDICARLPQDLPVWLHDSSPQPIIFYHILTYPHPSLILSLWCSLVLTTRPFCFIISGAIQPSVPVTPERAVYDS